MSKGQVSGTSKALGKSTPFQDEDDYDRPEPNQEVEARMEIV
jgi:hypothetical protein